MGVVLPLQRPDEAPEASDGDLVRRAVDGDRGAKEMLYRRHVSMATGLAHRILGGVEVDDLVQDAFVTAFEKLPTLRDPQSFAKWLGTILIHNARARIRRRKRRRRFFAGSTNAVSPDDLVARSAPPDMRAELVAIYTILETLPTDARIALVLRRVEGLSINEIAERMDRSPATVKRRVQDADVLLQAYLARGSS